MVPVRGGSDARMPIIGSREIDEIEWGKVCQSLFRSRAFARSMKANNASLPWMASSWVCAQARCSACLAPTERARRRPSASALRAFCRVRERFALQASMWCDRRRWRDGRWESCPSSTRSTVPAPSMRTSTFTVSTSGSRTPRRSGGRTNYSISFCSPSGQMLILHSFPAGWRSGYRLRVRLRIVPRCFSSTSPAQGSIRRAGLRCGMRCGGCARRGSRWC